MGKSQGTRNEEGSHSNEWIRGFLRNRGGGLKPYTPGELKLNLLYQGKNREWEGPLGKPLPLPHLRKQH